MQATHNSASYPDEGARDPEVLCLLLDKLDRELDARGHRFVRYADDCNIYVGSRRAGVRVMSSISGFLTARSNLRELSAWMMRKLRFSSRWGCLCCTNNRTDYIPGACRSRSICRQRPPRQRQRKPKDSKAT